MIETRTTATPLYPGSFMSESGESERVTVSPTAYAQSQFEAHPRCFAVEFAIADYERWRNDEGDERWIEVSDGDEIRWTIYAGKRYSLAELEQLSADNPAAQLENVVWNVKVNKYAGAVHTRLGNWQLLGDEDLVIPFEVPALM